MVIRWNNCENMRKFISAVESKYADRSYARFQNKPIADWIEWANRIVDWKDPLKEWKRLNIEEKARYVKQFSRI